jgi:hypothetical protein
LSRDKLGSRDGMEKGRVLQHGTLCSERYIYMLYRDYDFLLVASEIEQKTDRLPASQCTSRREWSSRKEKKFEVVTAQDVSSSEVGNFK